MNMLEKPTYEVSSPAPAAVDIGLNAAIVSMRDDQPQVLTVRADSESAPGLEGLPHGIFSPQQHRTLDIGLRSWVETQTGIALGYVEQLYTFGDRGRHALPSDTRRHIVSIGYLALTLNVEDQDLDGGDWRSWYQYFPWEDWRGGKPQLLSEEIEPRLRHWAARTTSQSVERPMPAEDRVRLCFGLDGSSYDEERTLDRYELLYEAGLVAEAERDGRPAVNTSTSIPQLGTPLQHDHRRILATAMGRLRSKIKYRPVIFEVMPERFTLFELQKTVEAILGSHLHKQNFRRLVESAGLVEPSGEVRTHTGGRPAKLYGFRREVLMERPSAGVRIKAGRSI